MKPYGILAQYYDDLMFGFNYSERADYLQSIFKKHGFSGNSLVDLACGTGSLTFELAKRGFNVIGVDFSEEMLTQAYKKAEKSGFPNSNPFFICEDMRKLELMKKTQCVVSLLDGINHLGSLNSVKETFNSVSLSLEKDGIFVFDLNSPFKIKNVLGNNTFVYDLDDIYCVWENTYNEKSSKCRFDLTFFERNGQQYLRSDESFSEISISTAQVNNRLKNCGMTLEAVYDDMSFDSPNETSERLIYVAKKL
jgi:SAM-dependent methyltransferase